MLSSDWLSQYSNNAKGYVCEVLLLLLVLEGMEGLKWGGWSDGCWGGWKVNKGVGIERWGGWGLCPLALPQQM